MRIASLCKVKKLYPAATPFKTEVGLAHYEIGETGLIYRTLVHPMGWSGLPEYELRQDMKIYRTLNHPHGLSVLPEFEVRNSIYIYRLAGHPDGARSVGPDYELR